VPNAPGASPRFRSTLKAQDPAQVAEVGNVREAGLHREDDLLDIGCVALVEVGAPVNSFVGALSP
jgi:hypothetical protein